MHVFSGKNVLPPSPPKMTELLYAYGREIWGAAQASSEVES